MVVAQFPTKSNSLLCGRRGTTAFSGENVAHEVCLMAPIRTQIPLAPLFYETRGRALWVLPKCQSPRYGGSVMKGGHLTPANGRRHGRCDAFTAFRGPGGMFLSRHHCVENSDAEIKTEGGIV